MKKIVLVISLFHTFLLVGTAQSASENISIRLVVINATTLEVQINTDQPFPSVPVAAEFNLILDAPATAITGNEVFLISDNLEGGGFSVQAPFMHSGRFYFAITYSGSGFSLSRFTSDWETVMTINVTNAINIAAFNIADASSDIFIDFSPIYGPIYRSAINVQGYNELFPFSMPDATLPVELTHFTAQAQSDNTALLSWQTATEINNDYFEIEHSTDGIDFRAIGKERGAGTTNEVQNYNFLHRQPVVGTNYYRLKQVDFDGAFEYSQVETVLFNGDRSQATNFKLFPNPSKNYLMILSPDKKKAQWDVAIFDLQGGLMSRFVISDDFYRLNTAEWPTGIYHIQVSNGTRTDQLRFVKD